MNRPRYPGWASHPELGENPVPGVITVSAAGLAFEADVGRVGIPLDRIRLERDPDGHLRITDARQADPCLLVPEDRILADYFLRQNNAARAEIRRFRQSEEGSRSLRLALLFLAVSAGLVFFLFVGGRIASAVVVARVSPAYEAELGQEVLEQLELTFEEDSRDLAWLQALLSRVTAQLSRSEQDRYDWRVMIAVNPFPNAASLPGGTVVVTSGLLTRLTEPDEMAAVLAHEVAHISHRHGVRSLIRILGPYYALQVFTLDRQAFVRTAGGAALLVSRQFYSRKQELEADQTAVELLRKAQLDPRSLARGLERLRDPGNRLSPSVEPPRFLLSHPPDDERFARIESYWASRPVHGPFAPLPPRP